MFLKCIILPASHLVRFLFSNGICNLTIDTVNKEAQKGQKLSILTPVENLNYMYFDLAS